MSTTMFPAPTGKPVSTLPPQIAPLTPYRMNPIFRGPDVDVPNRRMRWDRSEVDLMLKLTERGFSNAQIAMIMGRTMRAVIAAKCRVNRNDPTIGGE